MDKVAPHKFDTSQTARWLETGDLRFQKIYLSVLVVFGIGFVIVGISASIILVVGGVALIALAVFNLMRVHRGAIELIVDEAGIVLRSPSNQEYTIQWHDPHTRIEIVDWRSVPVERRNTRIKELEFVLRSRGKTIPLEAGIPIDAVKVIVADAREHGLSVSGWSEVLDPGSGASHIWIQHS